MLLEIMESLSETKVCPLIALKHTAVQDKCFREIGCACISELLWLTADSRSLHLRAARHDVSHLLLAKLRD